MMVVVAAAVYTQLRHTAASRLPPPSSHCLYSPLQYSAVRWNEEPYSSPPPPPSSSYPLNCCGPLAWLGPRGQLSCPARGLRGDVYGPCRILDRAMREAIALPPRFCDVQSVREVHLCVMATQVLL
ncbi:hypothetical protein Pmani_017892 [Petrolisthes manimaculis]|uniref:Uncharacterized protein n=1 Tax=Petrolisthes manimaculis TaxID=1843537 RepID=A0AAE1U8X2_9EUCA|nr:hypothetical protein Pmani_017892 [Petrolisthes manimaculis]